LTGGEITDCGCLGLVYSYSLSVDILDIFLKLKERLSLKRSRKFEVIYNTYLMKDGKNESLLRIFLDKRRKVVYTISTRAHEEELKRVEDEVKSVSRQPMHKLCAFLKLAEIIEFQLFVVIDTFLSRLY
jgi:NCAIR mutase (PurE)-related protein